MPERPQFAPRRHRAQLHVTEWQRAKPWRRDYWQLVDALRAQQGRDWPSYCYLPLDAAAAVALEAWRRHRVPIPEADQGRGQMLAAEASELATYAAWRVTQGIYRFDSTLTAALIDTPLAGDLPSEVFRHAPEWCVYIETPGETVASTGGPAPLHGYYAWLDCDRHEDGLDTLTLALDAEGLPLAITHVPLVGSIDQSIRDVVRRWEDSYETGAARSRPRPGYAEEARRTLPPLLSRLLYLCVENADITGRGDARPTRPRPTKTRHGWRLFPADSPTTWEVGARLGAALRRAIEAPGEQPAGHPGGHARPRAHIRRAHWHGHWRGPVASDSRELVLRWHPPTPVNVKDLNELPATIRPVD